MILTSLPLHSVCVFHSSVRGFVGRIFRESQMLNPCMESTKISWQRTWYFNLKGVCLRRRDTPRSEPFLAFLKLTYIASSTCALAYPPRVELSHYFSQCR